MKTTVNVIGGGLAGLTAAITAAENDAQVRLFEAHSHLGGRGRAIAGPYLAHEGAHVFYADGPHYRWLKHRGFVDGLGWPKAGDWLQLRFRADGRLRRLPPAGFASMQSQTFRSAPVDTSFRDWASKIWGEHRSMQAASAITVVTYRADTADLSAAYVWDLFGRVYGPRVPGIRWVRGGWQQVLDRMASRAIELGVAIETSARIDSVPDDGPTIVATDLDSARRLLGDETLRWDSGATGLLDVAVPFDRRDRTLVFDLDEGAFHESYSMQDDSAAPSGESLFQLQMPLAAGESVQENRERLGRFAAQTVPEWEARATFHRFATARNRTGAVDLPGHTWRDRPAIDRGADTYLVGDMVAAPGMRGEISINSAIAAAELATAARSALPTGGAWK